MSLENSLQEIGAGLISVRANERKKNAESLKNFLTGNAAPSLLSDNTLKRKGYTWNHLFDDIHEYVLKELEKYETSKTFYNATAPLCSTLLHLCVAGSNKGRAHISCEKLMEACLYILKDKRMATAIGDAYLNLLYKHVLPYDHYISFVTPATWADLLDVSIDISLENHTKLDRYTLLRLVWLVMKKGISCCQFVIPLRDALPKLKKCFCKVDSDKKIQEIVIEITVLLLETLSSESRLTMCEFTESVLTLPLKYYNPNIDCKKKTSVFKLLYLTIVLHHPEGKLQSEEGSLAHNWSIWNKFLHSIMEITCSEANYLQKLRKPNDNSIKHCTYYFRLSAAVYFLNFKFLSICNEEEESQSKKRRVSLNNYRCLSDLVKELQLNYVSWLGVINAYVQNYGCCMKTSECMALLDVAESLILNNVSNFDWNTLEQMICSVVKRIVKQPDCNKEQLDQVFTTLWNSCVRNSSSCNDAHKPIHSIMQCLLELDSLPYQTVQPLLKLYFEKGMPISDPSINTLCCIYHKYYSKCSYPQERKKCFEWYVQGNVGSTPGMKNIRELFLRLISNNNLNSRDKVTGNLHHDVFYETLFVSTEKRMLFSEGVLDVTNETTTISNDEEPLEINIEMADLVQQYLHLKLTEYVEKLSRCEILLLEFVHHTQVVIAYFEAILGINCVRRSQIDENELFCSLKRGLRMMCTVLAGTLKEAKDERDRVTLLQCIQSLWVTDYHPVIDALVRDCVDQDFFSIINEILSKSVSKADDEMEYEEDDDPNATRHNCIWLLAAYCRRNSEYRDEILELILDPVLYDFTSLWDVKCAFQCIKILSERSVTDGPLASIFALMRNMCQELFRNSEATETLLELLIDVLDRVWKHDPNMRQNCFIMIKSYLQRSEKLYYPPHVAALVYKCVAKIIELNCNNDSEMDDSLKDALITKMRGNTHSLRLYICYMLNMVSSNPSELEIEAYLTGLVDIFVTDVSDSNANILKDESVNRTLTILHGYLALAQAQPSSIYKIVTKLLQLRKEKSLEMTMTKTFLDKITKNITPSGIEAYLNNNILPVINYWILNQNKLEELPLYFFGYPSFDAFLEKNMKWLISAEILWLKEGNVKKSDLLNLMKTKSRKSEETLVEICFANIVSLCLPYVVTEKYSLGFPGTEQTAFKQTMKSANKMFHMTREILDNLKWSNLFAENIAEIFQIAAMHLRDRQGAKELFQVNIPQMTESYLYSKTVFCSILKYFGELIEGNIMQYLCSDQAITVFEILFKLWENVLQEKVFEYRALSLYTFVTFVQCIPLGYDSDAFVCSFTCNSLTNVIKTSTNKEEVRIFVLALKNTLTRVLPQAIGLIRKSVLKALAVLLIKKEQGYDKECNHLLRYLTVDMKDHIKESEDVVDFSNASHGAVVACTTAVEFSERLKTYNFTLSCPSHESLKTLRQFIKLNKHSLAGLFEELKAKRFAEECKTSIIHQVIYALSNIIQSSSDDKIIIEACNCLSEIGTYDLKTIVTVPPPDTKRVIHFSPNQCFAFAVVAALSEVLSDENPDVTNRAVVALSDLFKYREGKEALELADVNVQLLKPFLNTNSTDNAEFSLNSRKMEESSDPGFWVPKEKEDHNRWVTRITAALLGILTSELNYLKSLQEVCAIKPTISRQTLPSLVGLLLHSSPEVNIKSVSDQINNFFKYFWKMNFDDDLDNSGSYTYNRAKVIDHDLKMIIRFMLEVVHFVRLQRTHYKSRPDRTTLDSLNYMRLDYDKVAWAASMADQNVVAIYYGELWAVACNDGIPPSTPEVTTKLNGGENIQRVFRKCFISIGEMDAVDGCGTAHLTSEDEKRKHLINTGQYADALLLHDIALSNGASTHADLQFGVVRSLYKSGLHHLALQYINSLPESDQMNDVKYDCLTCLGDWSNFVDTQNLEEQSRNTTTNPLQLIKAFRYACLKDCLNLQTGQDIQSKLSLPLNRAKLTVARWCQRLNMENCQSVYKVIANLHLFVDIEDYFSVRCNPREFSHLLNRWRVDKLPPFHDFKHLESLISQRSLILEHAGKANKNLLKEIVPLQLQYAELGLSNGRVQMAQRLISIAKNRQNSDAVSLVEGQVSWAKGHKEIALSLVRNVMNNGSANTELAAAALRQYGMWMAESKCDNPRDIINKYLKKSLDALDRSDQMKTRLKVYYDIATFADSEYKQVVAYMNSSSFEHRLKCMESMKGTADSLKSTQSSLLTKDEKKVLATTRGLCNLDEADIANTKAEKLRFLQLAMRYYLLSLKHSEENNLSVFRVISLWLDSPSLVLDAEGASFEELLHSIPSRKFLTVLPQLAPRLSGETSAFADNLTKILKRCAQDHPHHTLPILFSLKNSDKDKYILNASRGAGESARAPPEPRQAAAAALVETLSKHSAALAKIVSQMELVCNATITFANYKTQAKEQKQTIPSAELIHKLGPMDAIPVPIDTIPVRSDCNYSYVPTLVSFDNYFELVGGINCPKKINARRSDGKRQIVLVKGEDDLRQDAVMQQVFTIVNNLLEKDPVTSRNKLLIRTYKVVPMSRQSGVLEWCEGTLPLGAYLTGNTGAHARYRPKDLTCTAARTKFASIQTGRKSLQEKLAIYMSILKNFKPVFHHFFTEQYLDPVTWFERRLAYTKSVATSSMIGYILGLGDRHVQNILIDKNTAEVVHIDFGIAFDQGKALPTPETIPFRLTQDIIAGFGSSGVEGVFRKSCEKTMQLLRDNNETLLTILEVLLCDPFYSWTTKKITNTPKDANLNLAVPTGSVADLAQRTLLTVRSKLSGTECGAAGGVAVPGQVARLIRAATDPANLCRLFQGWQPYL